MKVKVSVVIGGIFIAYAAFVAVVILMYRPSPDEMSKPDRRIYNREHIRQLVVGASLISVRNDLGTPNFSKTQHLPSHDIVVLFYHTQQGSDEQEMTQADCTPLLFVNDKLIAWGQQHYQNHLAKKPSAIGD